MVYFKNNSDYINTENYDHQINSSINESNFLENAIQYAFSGVINFIHNLDDALYKASRTNENVNSDVNLRKEIPNDTETNEDEPPIWRQRSAKSDLFPKYFSETDEDGITFFDERNQIEMRFTERKSHGENEGEKIQEVFKKFLSFLNF